MAQQRRVTLKKMFSSGSRPSASNFEDLIDSMYNIQDDGISQNLVESKTQSAVGSSLVQDPQALPQNANDSNSIAIGKIGAVNDNTSASKENDESNKSDSAGITSQLTSIGTRTGSFKDPNIDPANVLADGKWHKILTGLDGLNAFEIIAMASGDVGKGDYAITYTIALSAFGDSKCNIIQNSARYKGLTKNLLLRWGGETHDYYLEIKTSYDFGAGHAIKYGITKLLC